MKTENKDITKLGYRVDAIVNSAHPTLEQGGGVCGAIHSAAGPGLAAECRRMMAFAGRNEVASCTQAAVTFAYKLNAEFVVHVVAPALWHASGASQWKPGKKHGPTPEEVQALRMAYRAAAFAAMQNGCQSVAFPLLGAGVYGWPEDVALAVAAEELERAEAECGFEAVLCLYKPPVLKFKLGKKAADDFGHEKDLEADIMSGLTSN